MAFFYPRTVYHTQPQANFTPVFHLLGSRSQCPRRTRTTYLPYRTVVRPWQPRFNVNETEDSYIVHGELPGWTKDQISVEFPDAQKLVITGTHGRSGASTEENTSTSTSTSDSVVEKREEEDVAVSELDTQSVTSEETKSVSSYQATVEDDDGEDDFEVIHEKSYQSEQQQQQSQDVQTPAPQEPTEEKIAHKEPTQAPPVQTENERVAPAVVFSRSYTFPAEVDYDIVSANIKDGLLRIVVPKAKRPAPRRIAIN